MTRHKTPKLDAVCVELFFNLFRAELPETCIIHRGASEHGEPGIEYQTRR